MKRLFLWITMLVQLIKKCCIFSCFLHFLIVIPILQATPKNEQNLYTLPFIRSKNNPNSLISKPVISLKLLMQSAKSNEIRAIKKMNSLAKQARLKWCNVSVSNLNTYLLNQKKIAQDQWSQWQLIQNRYEKQLSSLIENRKKNNKSQGSLISRSAVINLQHQRQDILEHFWETELLQYESSSTGENCLVTMQAIQLPNNLVIQPLYLSYYKYWKQIPFINRIKLLTDLSH